MADSNPDNVAQASSGSSMPGEGNSSGAAAGRPTGPILLAVSSRDLIWSTRIMGTAKELGVSCRNFPFLSQALTEAPLASPRVLMLDLGGVAAADLSELPRLRAALPPPARIIAFGSHVDVPILHAAHAAGFDAVMARSEFSDRLLSMLQSLLGSA